MSHIKQIRSSRDEFLRHAQASESGSVQSIVGQVNNGQRKLVDRSHFVRRAIGGVTQIDLLQSDDDIIRGGIRSLAKQQLPKGEIFLVHSIQLLGLTAGAAIEEADLGTLDYDSIKAITELANAETELSVNQKVVLPAITNQVFVTEGYNVQTGLFPLTNPFLIEDQVDIAVSLRSRTAFPANTAVFFVMYGTATAPN